MPAETELWLRGFRAGRDGVPMMCPVEIGPFGSKASKCWTDGWRVGDEARHQAEWAVRVADLAAARLDGKV